MSDTNLTLDELETGKSKNLAPVDIKSMGLPQSEKKDESKLTPNILDDAFAALDNRIATEQAKANARLEEKMDDIIDSNLENYDPTEDDGPIGDIANVATPVSISVVNTMESDLQKEIDTIEQERGVDEPKQTAAEAEEDFNNIFKEDDDSDLSQTDKEFLAEIEDTTPDENADDDIQEDTTRSEEEDKVILDNYKKEVKAAITRDFNTQGFTVSKKRISMSKLLQINEPDKRVADWVLPTVGRSFSMFEFGGLDLQKINPQNSNRNRVNTIKDVYRTLYNHIVGATKDGFENWLRTTPYKDVQHLYFCAYKATFSDLNIVTYQCEDSKCGNIFIQQTPFENMYEVKEDKKEEFEKILSGDTSFVSEFETKIVPVSSQFAIGLIEPSIYSVEIEPLLIDSDMAQKFARIRNFLPFIEAIYYIDNDNKTYVPIDERPVAQDIAKTVKHKLAIYHRILTTLDNDQLTVLQAYVYNYQNRDEYISFFNPECTCPKCGKVISKMNISAAEMLFSRAQSPLVANLSER
jgi:hypothetical protein